MLVSFRVKNYRSFQESQTLSLVAGSGSARDSRFSFASNHSMAPHLLHSLCLLGPNGAGKSSLAKAMGFFREFVISSAKDAQEGEEIDVDSFLFHDESRGQPSEFEVIFIHDETLYQYGFAVDKKRVWSEWMFANPHTPGTKSRTLFQREYLPEEKDYAWKISQTHVKGEKEAWKNSTRDNSLFLSTAMQLKADVFKQPFDWIQKFFRIIDSPQRFSPGFTAHQCAEAGWKDRVLRFLQAADMGIEEIHIESEDFDLDKMGLKELPEEIRKRLKGAKKFNVTLSHRGNRNDLIPLDFEEESDGSRAIFSMAGPWLDVLDHGYTLVVDELHNSLHPHALRFLVDMFHNPEINTKDAQLIFTSHETSIMAGQFMHRDQICLVEKDDQGRSSLVPLSDFKERNVTAFQKAYLDGRYGAVPRLKEFTHE